MIKTYIESNIVYEYDKQYNSNTQYYERLYYNKTKNITTHFCMNKRINDDILYERVDQEGALYYIDLSNNELCFLDNTDFKKIKIIKYNNNSKTFSSSVKGKYCLFFDYDEKNKKNIYVCLSNSETHKIIRYINDGKDIDNRDENEIKITNIKATKTKPLSKGWEARGYCVGLSEENKKLEIYRIINDKAVRFYTYIIENENEYIDEDSIKLINAVSLEDNLCIYFKIIKDEEEIENKLLKIIDYRCFIDDVLFNNEYKNIDYDIEKSDIYYSKNVVAFKYYYIDENEEEKLGIIFYNINEEVIRNKTKVIYDNTEYDINKLINTSEKEEDNFIFKVEFNNNSKTGLFLYNYYEDEIKEITVKDTNGLFKISNECSYDIDNNNVSYLEYYAYYSKNIYLKNIQTNTIIETATGTSIYNDSLIRYEDILKGSKGKSYLRYNIYNVDIQKYEKFLCYFTINQKEENLGKSLIETYDFMKFKDSSYIIQSTYFTDKEMKIEDANIYSEIEGITEKNTSAIVPILMIDYKDSNIENDTIEVPQGEIVPLSVVITNSEYFYKNENDYSFEVKWYKNNQLLDLKGFNTYIIVDNNDEYYAELYLDNSLINTTNHVIIKKL